MSKFVRSIKNVASGYLSVQVLVRNATSNDPLGPTTYDMEEIALYTHSSQTEFLEIMDMLDRRLNDKGKNWRHVAKSLTVLDYLVRYGLEKCVLWLKDNLYIIKTLREFIHFDELNNDQGALIRVKAKELVLLLRNDERLRHERELAGRAQNGHRADEERGDRRRRNGTTRSRNDPYDDDLQRALELSRMTAEQERDRPATPDDDLQAALKLLMEEEEMRRMNQRQDTNLLDLDDQPQQQPQYYMATGYYQQQQQQPQYYVQQQFPQQQYDMFGNPIQNAMATGLYQQQFVQPQQPQFTGFNYGQQDQSQQQQQQQQPLQALKTGSNNPFALRTEQPQSQQPLMAQQQAQQQAQQSQQVQQQPFYTQPKPASTSVFSDDTHAELNNLLAQGTGIDTFGNQGDSRIPHQHTQTQNFINSSGTGYRQETGAGQRLSSNATGNPFLNTGIGYQATQAQVPTYTGYGFGNAPRQQQRSGNDGPSLIDI